METDFKKRLDTLKLIEEIFLRFFIRPKNLRKLFYFDLKTVL